MEEAGIENVEDVEDEAKVENGEELWNVGCGGSVVSSVLCYRMVADSNPTPVAT